MGRPAKPTIVKINEGNPGKRPLNTSEPKTTMKIQKPRNLSKSAGAVWGKMVKWLGPGQMEMLEACDEIALAMLAENYAEWWECVREIRKKGRTIKVPNHAGETITKTNPLVHQASDLQRRLMVLISRFGFTPVDRVKLGTTETGQGEFEDMLNKFVKKKSA